MSRLSQCLHGSRHHFHWALCALTRSLSVDSLSPCLCWPLKVEGNETPLSPAIQSMESGEDEAE